MTPFFFSSRRRHTRCLSDWSSDVCSSDLLLHVVDAADPRLEQKLEAVERLLTELHLEEIGRASCREREYGKHDSVQAKAGFRDYAPSAYSSSTGWSVFYQ